MAETSPFTVALPDDLAALIEAKRAAGDYATAADVIREGLAALEDRDLALETWLTTEVARSYDEFAADPASGIPAEEVMARIRAAFDQRPAKILSR